MRKRIAILGSTGSVGESAVSVALSLRSEFDVRLVAAKSNLSRLSEQCRELDCPVAVCADEGNATELQRLLPPGSKALGGGGALADAVTAPDIDIVLCAIVGTGGLAPVLSAIRAGKSIALASKEVLVMAGGLVMEEAKSRRVDILPVDSEHSAIFQCLEGRHPEDVASLILTASGGPFRGCSRGDLEKVTYEEALAHPTWDMGPKITVDSATLMNKALEMIEAAWLFNVTPSQIKVVVHPQSIVHSLVEFTDGTMLAQLSEPDMRFPIQYALTYPRKMPGGLKPLNLAAMGVLTFHDLDRAVFPAIDFAYEAMRVGGTLPAVMNAANEVAVDLFRRHEITLPGIWQVVDKVMGSHLAVRGPGIGDILAADAWARAKTAEAASSIRR